MKERSPPKSSARQNSSCIHASPDMRTGFLAEEGGAASPEMKPGDDRRSKSSRLEFTKSAMYRNTNPARTLPIRRPMTREESVPKNDSFAASMVVRIGSVSMPERLSMTWSGASRRWGVDSNLMRSGRFAVKQLYQCFLATGSKRETTAVEGQAHKELVLCS